MAIYTQPDDLLKVGTLETILDLCEKPDATDLTDDDVKALIRAQAEHAAAEIDAALAHRFTTVPAPFVTRNELTGTLAFTQWSDEVTGTDTAFDTELAVGDGISDDSGNWAQVVAIKDATSLTLENPWRSADYSGASTRGEVQRTIAFISHYLVLESLYSRSPAFQGGLRWIDELARVREILADLKKGAISLAELTQFEKARCDAQGLDYETEDIFGVTTRYRAGELY